MLESNRAIIIGHISAEPRDVSNSIAATQLTVRTSERLTRAGGKKTEMLDWHRVVLLGKMSDLMCSQVSEGDKVLVKGTMHNAPRMKGRPNQYATNIIVTAYKGDTLKLLEKNIAS